MFSSCQTFNGTQSISHRPGTFRVPRFIQKLFKIESIALGLFKLNKHFWHVFCTDVLQGTETPSPKWCTQADTTGLSRQHRSSEQRIKMENQPVNLEYSVEKYQHDRDYDGVVEVCLQACESWNLHCWPLWHMSATLKMVACCSPAPFACWACAVISTHAYRCLVMWINCDPIACQKHHLQMERQIIWYGCCQSTARTTTT